MSSSAGPPAARGPRGADDPAAPAGDALILHASAVALDSRRGVLILGGSGAGKSALALALMAMGAQLVADDRVCLQATDADLFAQAPERLRGLIEARGMGLLAATALPRAALRLVVDLDSAEAERLPPYRECVLLGRNLPLFRRVDGPHFAAGILQALKGGRAA